MIQAKNFKPGRSAPINLIVLHTMEWTESPTTAQACAAMFHSPTSPVASAHYCVDSDNVIQCVSDRDTAWHTRGRDPAGVDVNDRSIGIELAGYARQTAEDWADPYSTKMLDKAAELVASLCTQYNIPVAEATVEQLVEGGAGITTHRACTLAFKVTGGHMDPGVHFPMSDFLARVASYIAYPR